MQNIEGGFTLTALLDGTTINGILRVDGLPLVQRFVKNSTGDPIPNFEAADEAERPTVVLIVRDVTTGNIVNLTNIDWKYNGVSIFIDGKENPDLGGKDIFKSIPDYEVTIEGRVYQVPALRVMKNLVVIGGYDNDRISVSGQMEISGRKSLPFQEISKEVIIQETSGNSYDVVISDDKGGALLTDKESLSAVANLYKDGAEVSDYNGVSFQWVKLLGTGDEKWGTARQQSVSTDDIDNILKLRCDVTIKGAVVASGFTQISDFSDPYWVDFKFDGISGNTVRPGETALVTPVAKKRKTGETVASITSWSFTLADNAGQPFTLTGKDSSTFTATSASISYDDMKRADMGLSGSVSAVLTQ